MAPVHPNLSSSPSGPSGSSVSASGSDACAIPAQEDDAGDLSEDPYSWGPEFKSYRPAQVHRPELDLELDGLSIRQTDQASPGLEPHFDHHSGHHFDNRFDHHFDPRLEPRLDPHLGSPFDGQPDWAGSALPMVLGWLIALATLVVPMTTVVAGRHDRAIPRAIPAAISTQELQPAGRLASTGLNQSGAGAIDHQPEQSFGRQQQQPSSQPQRR